MNITRVVGGLRAGIRGFYREGLARRVVDRGSRVLIPVALAAGASSCAVLQDFNTFTPQQDVRLGTEAYGEILAGEPLIQSGAQFQMVRTVTQNLVNAAQDVNPELTALFEWEVALIDDPGVVNAFCLPGGKMAVYTGILPVCEGPEGLAVVMGHEIAHALERHGTSAMSKQLAIQFGSLAAVAILLDGEGTDDELTALGIAAAGTLLGLKFGRDAEYEADVVGLEIMARAGYDPREAVSFWQRMDALGGAAGPEWLSTHPSNANRVRQIQERLPVVMPLYEAAN